MGSLYREALSVSMPDFISPCMWENGDAAMLITRSGQSAAIFSIGQTEYSLSFPYPVRIGCLYHKSSQMVMAILKPLYDTSLNSEFCSKYLYSSKISYVGRSVLLITCCTTPMDIK